MLLKVQKPKSSNNSPDRSTSGDHFGQGSGGRNLKPGLVEPSWDLVTWTKSASRTTVQPNRMLILLEMSNGFAWFQRGAGLDSDWGL